MNKKLLLGILLLLIFTNIVKGQEETPRKIGLSALATTSQLDILVPIWVAEKIVLAPAISTQVVKGAGSDIGIGLVPRFYFKTEKLAPYVGGRVAALFNIPKEGENTTDILVGLSFGGEYFFNRHFSLGVEAQGNFTFSDKSSSRFGNPGGSNFNTGSAIIANIYF